MSASSATAVCPKCGRALALNAPEGLCVKCLFAGMLDGGPLDEASRPTVQKATFPREFGAYELLEEMARGGMSIVYRARQTQVNRLVAVKVLAAGAFASEGFQKRFQTEAEAVAILDHPGIVPIYEVGECEGQPFFSMKLLEGGSLAQRISNLKTQISNREAAVWIAQLARTVHFAHQRGILHRDIKPGNVLLDTHGEPHLTDFGLAKLVERESTLTHTMAIMGTPCYMSPEQARGETKQVTTAVDVYGLGAVFYELLTRELPFAGGTTMETVRLVLEKEPRRPTEIRPQTDRDLETICLKCLEKEPARRYGSALELAEDLERWLRHEPILARPSSPAERAVKWVRRHPLAASLSAVTLLSIAASVGILIRANIHIRAAQANEAHMRQMAQRQERVTRQRAYASDINLAQQALAEHNLGRARELLNRLRPGSTNEPDLRGWEWRYLWRQCRSDALFTLASGQGSVLVLTTSPDSRWLALGGVSGGRLALWDLTTRQEVKRLADGVTSVRAAFSPTEPLLAYASTSGSIPTDTIHRLRLWNTATQAKAGEWRLPGRCAGMAFSTDGQTLLTAIDEPEPQFVLWNVKDRTERSKLPTAPMLKTIGTTFAVTRDLRWVASGLEGNRIRVTDLTTGSTVWETNTVVPVNSLSIAPTGTTLAAGLRHLDPFIQLYDLPTGKEIGRLPIRAGYVISMEFGPDGRTLLAAGSDQTITQWDVTSRQILATLRGHLQEVWRVALLPDGKTFVSGSADGDVLLWSLEGAGTKDFRSTLRNAPRACWQFAAGSDAIITVERGGVIRWSGPDFSEQQSLLELGDSTHFFSVALSEDGSTVAAIATNGIVRAWNLKDASLRNEFKSSTNKAVIWGFAEKSNRLLVVTDPDQSFHEWDLRTGTEVEPRPDLADWRLHGAFPNGLQQRFLAPNIRRRLDSLPKAERPPESVSRAFWGAFSLDHRYFARARGLQLEDAATGQLVGPLRGLLHGVHSVAFSPDSQRVVAGSDDRQAVKIWDTQTLQELLTLRGESTFFSQTRFSPDGNLLATMSFSGVLHVWRAPSWAEIEMSERNDAQELRGP